jgi:hypothetical protein
VALIYQSTKKFLTLQPNIFFRRETSGMSGERAADDNVQQGKAEEVDAKRKATAEIESRIDAKTAALFGHGSSEPMPVQGGETPREVSAATIGRLMGLVTQAEMKLLEGKIDMIASKLTSMSVRLEKAISMLSSAPTGADLERIDVQIGALKTAVMEGKGSIAHSEHKTSAGEGARARSRIMSNMRQEADEPESE